MNGNEVLGILQQLGLDKYLPILFAFHALASIIDAMVPQPVPGSHWLLPRKILSVVALNVANASNACQPPLVTWLVRFGGALQSAAEAQQAQAPVQCENLTHPATPEAAQAMSSQRPVLVKPQTPPPPSPEGSIH